ncbi:beta/gamma crystallin-related protein [Maricaulis parjimensis]|uniref:beta/gamma crystallin-related protein n=1 Tax=Maricaulis parjimensis TaxID=144023 RepID=UPI001939AC6A|nr:beta/gamma crystallin-related protein [Maricaulis parjimensis]
MAMRKIVISMAALVAGGTLGATASAQEIILFDGPNFNGQQVRITGDVRNLDSRGFNDRTSSFRVVRGEWELCQHDDYRGTCITYSSDGQNLGRMNDQITSLRPVSGGGNRPGPGGGNRPSGEAITFYSGPNYTGRSVTLTVSSPDLRQYNFNDQARSVRHSGRRAWLACQHANFGGACMQIDRDMPNIGGGMSAEISSAEPDYGSRPGRGDRNDRPRNGVFLYDGVDFQGQRVDVSGDTDNLTRMGFNDRADSLIVARGETWVICEDDYMRGRCQRVEGEVRDLGALGLRNRITSLRRVDSNWNGGGWDNDSGWGNSRRSAILFRGPNFYGESVAIDEEVRDLRRYNFNDQASSIQIPRGQRWLVCEDSDFRGRCEELDDDVHNLSRYGLANRISSMRRIDRNWGGGGGWDRREEIILYDGFSQSGRSVRIDDEVTNLEYLGFNDRALSLEVRGRGRWLVCEDSNFRGRCDEVSGEVDNLHLLNREISSVRPIDY